MFTLCTTVRKDSRRTGSSRALHVTKSNHIRKKTEQETWQRGGKLTGKSLTSDLRALSAAMTFYLG